MKTLQNRTIIGALVALGILGAGAAAISRGQGGGAPAAANPPPTKLAVINVVSLFNDLTEEADAQAAIDAMKKAADEEARKRTDEIQKLQDAITHPMFNKESPEFKKQQMDAIQKVADLQAYQAMQQQLLLMEMRVRTAAIYKEINDAVADYAAKNGIAMVFVADDVNVENARTQEQLQAMVTVRKVIYFHPSFDITSAIKQKMNADYQLGTKKKQG